MLISTSSSQLVAIVVIIIVIAIVMKITFVLRMEEEKGSLVFA